MLMLPQTGRYCLWSFQIINKDRSKLALEPKDGDMDARPWLSSELRAPNVDGRANDRLSSIVRRQDDPLTFTLKKPLFTFIHEFHMIFLFILNSIEYKHWK